MAKQMKTVSSKSPVRKSAAAQPQPVLSARTLMLAGVGAATLLQRKGRALFATCVADGKQLQERGSQLAHDVGQQAMSSARSRLAPLQSSAQQIYKQGVQQLEQNLVRVIARAGVPTKHEVDALSARIDALSRKIRAAS